MKFEVMVFNCVLLSRRALQLSINPYLVYIFDLIPSVEEIRIQEGSLCVMPYALGILSWGTFSLAVLT